MSGGSSRKDPGWDHSEYVDPFNKDLGVRCKYCNKITKGGITRLKQHLAGGFRNATLCTEVPECVQQEMKALLIKKEISKKSMVYSPQFDEVVDEETKLEVESNDDEIHSKRPMSSTVSARPLKKPEQIGLLNWYCQKNTEDKTTVGSSCTIPSSNETEKMTRDVAVEKFARWMYDSNIAFDAVKYDSFAPMVEAIGQCGPGMKPPSYHEVRVSYLNKELYHTKQLMKPIEEEKEKHGCSLKVDGWRNRKGRTLINFLVNTSRGSMFIESVDASSYSHLGMKMFELFDSFVQRIGEENIVQVVTDTTSSNVFAGKKLEEKYRSLYWTPCAAHCLDLMFEDIFKLPKLKKTLERAINVNGYIYNHPGVLNMMREFTSNREMVRMGKTRFVTAFLTLERFHKQQANLKKMFTSTKWTSSKFKNEQQGKQVASIMLKVSFWKHISYLVKVGGPLLDILRLVDGEKKPPMGYIYEAIKKAKDKIVVAFNNNVDEYKNVFAIIDKRWTCQLHRPLHAAGYFLNPQCYYANTDVEGDEEIMKGLYNCIERLEPNHEIQDIISHELLKYKNGEGLFGLPIAIRQRSLLPPGKWWASFGSSSPNLKKFAIKVLNLTCSSYGCEHNWSVVEDHHSKRRSRLDQRKLDNVLFIKYNRALQRRYDMRDTIDPIIGDNVLDDSNEWIVGSIEESDEEAIALVDDDDDLTLDQIARCIRVGEAPCPHSLRGTASRARHRRRSGKKKSTSIFPLNLDDENDIGFDEKEERDSDGYQCNDEDNDEVDKDAMDDEF